MSYSTDDTMMDTIDEKDLYRLTNLSTTQLKDEGLATSEDFKKISSNTNLFLELIFKKYKISGGVYADKDDDGKPYINLYYDNILKKCHSKIAFNQTLIKVYKDTTWKDIMRIIDKTEEDKTCNICFEEDNKALVYCRKCSYKSCYDCVYEIMKRNHSRVKCPSCSYTSGKKIKKRDLKKFMFCWRKMMILEKGNVFKNNI